MNKRSTRRNEDQAHIAVRHGDDDRRDSGGGRIQHDRFYPDDDVLAELNELKEVAVLDPVSVRLALLAGKCLMKVVECILDEFDESELPFTRTAILAALLDAAAQMNQPFSDLATVRDLATVCEILPHRRLRRRAC